MLHVVIMAGGAGTRLSPLSTPEKPKQFLNLIDPHQSLLQQTVGRLKHLMDKKILYQENIWVVTHERYENLLKEQVPKLDCQKWFFEPAMKNTTACIGWAALEIQKKDVKAILLVLPSDQWVNDESLFSQDIEEGLNFINHHKGRLLTLGMKPTWPSPDYGYIEAGKKIENHTYAIERFVEKPSAEKACEYLKSDNFFWNGGTFIWKAQDILTEIKKYKPLIYDGLCAMNPHNKKDMYSHFEKISIDYAVMEHTIHAAVLKAHFLWSDLGTFESIERVKKTLQ